MALHYDINRLNSLYLVYLTFCLFVCIASSTELVKPNPANHGWIVFVMWLNVGATLVGSILGRGALTTELGEWRKTLSSWIVKSILLQLFANFFMLANLSNLNGFAEIANSDIFMLAYVVVFLVFTGYQLAIAAIAKDFAKPLKPEQIV